MEDILDLYEESYAPNRPIVCIDERPCQLIGDILTPIAMKSGKAMKVDYEYERKGTCSVWIVVLVMLRHWSEKRRLGS